MDVVLVLVPNRNQRPAHICCLFAPPLATWTVSNYQHRLGRIFLECLENGEAV